MDLLRQNICSYSKYICSYFGLKQRTIFLRGLGKSNALIVTPKGLIIDNKNKGIRKYPLYYGKIGFDIEAC